jgi:hypothetical protein
VFSNFVLAYHFSRFVGQNHRVIGGYLRAKGNPIIL